ncbi:MAG: bifunctional hydroxymethylpyrimidine kinase/phosphomethylpyrimidine kinase [Myxococcota bacterium]
MTPVVLTVAGSDPSGGAGVQGDLKTIHQHGAYGAAVVSLLTVQDTRGVSEAQVLDPAIVEAQLDGVLRDLQPAAAKTGALGSPGIVSGVGRRMAASGIPWVIDPVSVPSHGARLATADLTEAFLEHLLPCASLVTPNVPEAEGLSGVPVRTLADAAKAAERLVGFGAKAVLVTGGHLDPPERGTDVLSYEGSVIEFPPTRVLGGSFHGTGCALSAAIATHLAFGRAVPDAVARAKAWLEASLAHAFAVGAGAVPVNHLWPVDDEP